MRVECGVMVMKNGKAWGVEYADGHATMRGWVAPETAPIHDPRFCKKPTDCVYAGSPDEKEISTGKVVAVQRITQVIIEPDDFPYSTESGKMMRDYCASAPPPFEITVKLEQEELE